MGTYAKAGLAQGLSSGLMGMGSMLLDVQARNDQRAFREYQIKATAQERQDRLDDMEAERKSRDAATFRVAQAAEMAERKRQDEAAARLLADQQERRFFNTGQGLYTSVGNEIPTVVPGSAPTLTPSRSAAPPAAPTIRMEGRDFPDTPAGQAAALEWKKQVGGGAGSGNPMDDLQAKIGGLDTGGGGETAAPEGPGFFRRMGNRLGITEPEAPVPTTSTPARAFAGEAPPPFAGPQLPEGPSGLEQDIMAALSEGETPEKILSDMEAAGVPQEMMTQAAEILRNRAR